VTVNSLLRNNIHVRYKKMVDLTFEGATVTGIWTNWSVWSPCNVKCGQGFKWRIRTCTSVSPEDNGFDCNGNGTETVQCQNSECSG
jgi:hypothetical protein